LQRNQVMAANGASNFATSNVAAQFQDIAVTSAMGMSPMMIALQQGTQLSAALGNQGLSGTLRTLGGAFMSVVSPVSLVTIGLVAGTAAAIQYFSGLGSGAQDADERLDEHLERIEAIAKGYDEATQAAEDYIERGRKAPEASVAADLSADRETALKAVDEALSAIAQKNAEIAVDFMSWQANRMIHADLIQTMTDLGDLSITAESTQAEIDDLHTRLTILARDNSAPEQARQYANDLLDLMEQVKLATTELGSLGAALNALPSNIEVKLSLQMEGFNDAQATLRELMPDFRSSHDRARDKAETAYNTMRSSAPDDILRQQAAKDYQAVLAGIDRQEKEAAEKANARSARSDAKAANEKSDYERAIENIKDRTRAQELESNVVGLGTYASEKARAALELENAARKDATGLSADRIAQIDAEAAAYARVTATLERQQAGYNAVSQTAERSIDTIVDSLLEGETSIIDTLLNIGKEWAKLALQMAISNPLKNAFLGQNNPTFGDIGGFLASVGSFFGGGGNFIGGTSGAPPLQLGYQVGVGRNARGTAGWRGGPTWVGEEGPEIIDVPAGYRIYDAARSAQMAAAQNGQATGSSLQLEVINNSSVNVRREEVETAGGKRQQLVIEDAVAGTFRPGSSALAALGSSQSIRRF
jgi:hypothetical protein